MSTAFVKVFYWQISKEILCVGVSVIEI